jgi:hypothetical protein
MLQGLSAAPQAAVLAARAWQGHFSARMVQLGLVSLVAGVPIFLFLRQIRALRLTRGYAVVLTLPIVVGLWLVLEIIVGLGRL